MYKSANKLLKQLNDVALDNGIVPSNKWPQTPSFKQDIAFLKQEELIRADYGSNTVSFIRTTPKGIAYIHESKESKWDDFVHSFIYPVAVAIVSGFIGFLLGHYA